jgi:FtsZ-binding cell division protein ZapB
MTSTTASLEKKRLRDRRAQHAARARRDIQLHVLQQRVEQSDRSQAQLEAEVQQLRTAMDALRTENAKLRRRHTAVLQLLSDSNEFASSCPDGQKSHNDRSPSFDREQLDDSSSCSIWSRLPLNLPEDSLSASLMPWLLCPAVVTHLSETPSGPDILYGSHTNPLSNAIHIAFSCALHGTVNDPERLALGESHVPTCWKCYSSRLTTVIKAILPTSSLNGV